MKLTTGSELPICVGNLLDQQEFNYAKEARGFCYNNSRLISKTGSCRLVNYTAERIVGCLDTLYHRDDYFATILNSNITEHVNSRCKELYFAFMGDSRMRQQFLNFIRVCWWLLPAIYHFIIHNFIYKLFRWFQTMIQNHNQVRFLIVTKATLKLQVTSLD